ncbi:50S ribosomal protein L28 [Candidatus Peregrinibacteria bacterium CG08_land_8_20_14_0_20_41_10]|nr:MAG: 50S ribosomal protein L28 [Candidatus Peregrinibacteria bacterium CG08_land_8_20_14_0_20_41_10]
MSRRCEVCGKGTTKGNNVSHSMRHTKRTFKVNLLTKKLPTAEGKIEQVKLCAHCYRTMRKENN